MKKRNTYLSPDQAKARRELQREIDRALDRSGYTALKAKGRKSRRPDLPDLSVEQRTAPTSDLAGIERVGGSAPRPLPEDAKTFTIGHLHKQGPVLVTPGTIERGDLQYFGGKKA